MRDFKGIKRNRNRNRNGGGGGGGGGKPQHNANRAFDSNGPDGMKVRGAAQHVYEKYQQLARDAHTAGDRVLAENHLQHAEHYFRVMRAMQPLRPLSDIIGRDQFISGYDIDFEDESGAQAEAAEAEAEAIDSDRNAETRQGDERSYREGRARDDWREDRGQSDRNGGGEVERPFRAQRDERPRDDRQRGSRDDRARAERPESRSEHDGYAPTAEPETPVLRADDGEVSHAPAFLQARPAEPRDETPAEPRRPRRRRPPREFTSGEGPAGETNSEEV